MATRKALQQEVTTEAIEFVFDGDTYTIPPARKWPLDVLRAQESGKMLGAVEALLGKEQMKKFEHKPRTIGDLEDLLELAFSASEIDPKD